MREEKVRPADWVVKAAEQTNSYGRDSFSQHGSFQPRAD